MFLHRVQPADVLIGLRPKAQESSVRINYERLSDRNGRDGENGFHRLVVKGEEGIILPAAVCPFKELVNVNTVTQVAATSRRGTSWYIQYDTIRYGRLTCAQKLTGWPPA